MSCCDGPRGGDDAADFTAAVAAETVAAAGQSVCRDGVQFQLASAEEQRAVMHTRGTDARGGSGDDGGDGGFWEEVAGRSRGADVGEVEVVKQPLPLEVAEGIVDQDRERGVGGADLGDRIHVEIAA